LKKVMLLGAMLAMVLAAAVPALAQSVTQVGSGNVACVQTAVQQEFGKTQIAQSQYGDATNINIQAISQECNVTVAQANTVVKKVVATASASATVAPKVQYSSASASASSAPAAQYQYSSPSATASASASPTAVLPETGGSSLIALGAGVLLVAGGLLARRIVR
jgi:LPXTG-motif cell wall-anchored protein